MPYALVIYFNKSSEKPFRTLWKQIADAGITSPLQESGIRPHLTLSVFDEIECLPCERELANFAQHMHILDLSASHIGVFTSPQPIVFIAPTPKKELILFHQKITELFFQDPASTRKMYQPGTWVPHCTVALNFEKEKFPQIMELCLNFHLPFKLQPAQIGVVEYQPVKPLFDFNLKSA